MESMPMSELFQVLPVYLKRSNQDERMFAWIKENFPDVVKKLSMGRESRCTKLLEMLNLLNAQFDNFDCRVIEPVNNALENLKKTISDQAGLLNCTFEWLPESTKQYEARRNQDKFHLILLVNMLYHVESFADSLKYYYDVLEDNGIMLIVINSDVDDFWYKLQKDFCPRLKLQSSFLKEAMSSGDVCPVLDRHQMKYDVINCDARLDVTDCLETGNKDGEMVLNFLFAAKDFQKCPQDIKTEFMDYLRLGDCSYRKDDDEKKYQSF
ncbi:histamine N-methyltransferase-like [Glandiceps talaboti]